MIGLSYGNFQSGAGFDPDASAVIAQMTANGSTPTEVRQSIINQLVLDLKGLGNTGSTDIWSSLDVLQIYAAEDAIQAKTEWINADGTFDAVEINAPSFTTDVGYSSSSNKGIDTSFNPSSSVFNYTLNNNSFGVYAQSGASASYLCGANPTAISGSAIRNLLSDSDQTNNSSTYWLDSFDSLTGLQTNSRSNSTTVALYNNTSSKNGNKSSTSSSIPNFNFYVLGRNLNGVLSNTHLGSTVSLFYVGANITGDINQFYNSLNAYLTAVAP